MTFNYCKFAILINFTYYCTTNECIISIRCSAEPEIYNKTARVHAQVVGRISIFSDGHLASKVSEAMHLASI